MCYTIHNEREGGKLVSEAQKNAKRRYDKKTTQYVFRFRNGADSDVIEKLKSVSAKTEYVRKLIREDMGKETA